MEVEFLLYSTFQNESTKRTFFSKRFQWPAPPQTSTVIPLMSNYGKGRFLPGVITHVEIQDGCAKVKLGTEESTGDLRDGFVPDGWKEISH